MARFAKALLWVLALGAQALSAQAPSIEPVLRAELAFAAQADRQGIRRAFLTWLVEDAKVFKPGMVTARAHYGPEPGDPGHLAWYPEAMGIAGSGDLAWSLGPWTWAPGRDMAGLVHGHYLSLWRRQPTGAWRVVADIGVPHAAPLKASEPFAPWDAPPGRGKPPAAGPDPAQQLRQREAALAAAWSLKGGLALLPELARGARILRPRAQPLQADQAIREALRAEAPAPGGEPAVVQAAASGDLGWTCGEAGPDATGAGASFLRIWILEGGAWKVLFDVRLPIPKSQP
ncbi:MAG: hypothetical protein H6P99_1425 [Holophagaceae bacterium]|nr:hypothetical protein [Holophagaceae bacterium]